jgi:acyl-CoA synthetase (AMP-forming)/AMP-acid ligase II
VGIGEEGEIWVRGPQVMKGYLNNPQATKAMIDSDGWLRTGDLGHIDADGHLYVVDRLKELIKYKGFQVPPAELEAVLLRHPDVVDAAVIGVPDDEAGEVPVGYVALRPGAASSPEEIRQFADGQVANYKRLRRLEVIDAIPKSASGKILRRVLRDAATA